MPVRYYPSSRVKINQVTKGGELLLNGKPYVGRYYSTYDGKHFSGPDPMTGPSDPLSSITNSTNTNIVAYGVPPAVVAQLNKNATKAAIVRSNNVPKSYYPKPIQSDYDLGYIDRYFLKKQNDKGYIMEISPLEYVNINNGTATYDTTFLETQEIRWKLTGPLNSIRLSQYNTRAGIIDTNKRLVENANPNFFGLIEFIGGEYDKWAKPTK